MFKTFQEAITLAQKQGPKTVSVAVADDLDVLKAISKAEELGLINSVLVGNEEKIKGFLKEVNLKKYEIINETNEEKAALKAAQIVREKKAQIVMKGQVNSSVFLKAVLNKEFGLRKSKLLSHLSIFEVPKAKRLFFVTDGGMNVLPSLEEKELILRNALEMMLAMGFEKPKVAVLSHNEKVNEKMPSTVDAQALVEKAAKGEFPPCIIEGPMALDVAAEKQAAIDKNIESKISGEVDLWLMPNIESGNIFGKSLVYFAGAHMAGLILGAAAPVILASRADDLNSKIASISLACLSAN